jgi:uncharacterized NAD(P)/FAD-binding protein YdhS
MSLSPRLIKMLQRDETISVAIVGGGVGATELVNRLIEAAGSRASLQITIYEPRARLGRGIAWQCSTEKIIANMRLETLGPTYPQAKLIQEYLQELNHPQASSEYPSRNAMGEALDLRWAKNSQHNAATLAMEPYQGSRFRHNVG